MDIKYLQENQQQLFQQMKDAGYATDYIYRFQVLVQYILANNEHERWNSYVDIYESFKKTTTSVYVQKQAYTIFNGIKKFHLDKNFPGKGVRQPLISYDAFSNLVPEFQNLITHYRIYDKERGKKDKTIYIESNCGVTFLSFAQSKGRLHLKDISEKDVLSFFLNDEGKLSKSRTYVKNLRAVFKTGMTWKHSECQRILNLLPKIHHGRKIIQYLTEDEILKIKEVLNNHDINLSLRDRAIGLLLVHYGLRRSDISGLRLDAIDWDSSIIRIAQQKTGYPFEMPLIPVVGNALYDYIIHERPETDVPYVFLSESTPVNRVCGCTTINDVVNKVLKLAELRQNSGERKGAHIFRHHFATALMENGIPQPVISKSMGHTDPVSVETYLYADFAHLKECALSIEDYPVPEEVFRYAKV